MSIFAICHQFTTTDRLLYRGLRARKLTCCSAELRTVTDCLVWPGLSTHWQRHGDGNECTRYTPQVRNFTPTIMFCILVAVVERTNEREATLIRRQRRGTGNLIASDNNFIMNSKTHLASSSSSALLLVGLVHCLRHLNSFCGSPFNGRGCYKATTRHNEERYQAISRRRRRMITNCVFKCGGQETRYMSAFYIWSDGLSNGRCPSVLVKCILGWISKFEMWWLEFPIIRINWRGPPPATGDKSNYVDNWNGLTTEGVLGTY